MTRIFIRVLGCCGGVESIALAGDATDLSTLTSFAPPPPPFPPTFPSEREGREEKTSPQPSSSPPKPPPENVVVVVVVDDVLKSNSEVAAMSSVRVLLLFLLLSLLLVLRRRRDGVCFFLLGFPGCELTCGETKLFFFLVVVVVSQRVSAEESKGAQFSFLFLFTSCIVIVIAVNGSRPIDRGILNKRRKNSKKKCGKRKREIRKTSLFARESSLDVYRTVSIK